MSNANTPNTNTPNYVVGMRQTEIDDFHRRLDAGEEVFTTNKFGVKSRVYRKDGKLYDSDRAGGIFDSDREIKPIDNVPNGPETSRWWKLIQKYGAPSTGPLVLAGHTWWWFEKNGEVEVYMA